MNKLCLPRWMKCTWCLASCTLKPLASIFSSARMVGSGSSNTEVHVPGSADGTTSINARKINLPSKHTGWSFMIRCSWITDYYYPYYHLYRPWNILPRTLCHLKMQSWNMPNDTFISTSCKNVKPVQLKTTSILQVHFVQAQLFSTTLPFFTNNQVLF